MVLLGGSLPPFMSCRKPNKDEASLPNQRRKNDVVQDKCSKLEEVRCMFAGKGSRSRGSDKATLRRALCKKITKEKALRSHVASADWRCWLALSELPLHLRKSASLYRYLYPCLLTHLFLSFFLTCATQSFRHVVNFTLPRQKYHYYYCY